MEQQSHIRKAQSCATDPQQAAQEFHARVAQPDMALVVFFCSSEYDLDVLANEMQRLFVRTDGLIGLANRATSIERLSQAFAVAERGAPSFAIFYLDLDHFKEVSARIKNCTRASDVVARLGGDEFAILQLHMGEPANAGVLAKNIQTTNAPRPSARTAAGSRVKRTSNPPRGRSAGNFRRTG